MILESGSLRKGCCYGQVLVRTLFLVVDGCICHIFSLEGGREIDIQTEKEITMKMERERDRDRDRDRDREEIPNSQQDSPESFFNFFTVHIKC